MNRLLQFLIFLAGLIAAGWIGSHYLDSNPLALAVIALIGIAYLAGALELYRYQQATASLARALSTLSEPLDGLDEWLRPVHSSLRVPVAQRVQGARAGLPRPVLTPYLVGLLVLLGMLGTFLGMIATLRGTGLALESATDLAAIRASLAAPVQGLGFAFGTSVAGVATSAALGLLSALITRDRIQVSRELDARIAGALRPYSPTHQREEGYRLLQQQTLGMAAVADKLQAMMAAIEEKNASLNEQLQARQEQFHAKNEAAYLRLAQSVEQSLKASVAEGVRSAGTVIEPLVETTMSGLMQHTTALHDNITQAVRQQLDGVAKTFEQRSAGMLQEVSASLESTAGELSAAWERALSAQRADLAGQDEKRLAAMTASLTATSEALRMHWQDAQAQAMNQQQEICTTLAGTVNEFSVQAKRHADGTIEEMARLAALSADAPTAAAGLVAEVRQAFSDSMARDNAMLEERNSLLETSASLLDAMRHASSEQREAIDALLVKSADVLDRVGTRFTDQTRSETERLAYAASQITGSAIEVASLGDAFGSAVHAFGASNAVLVEHLQRMEAALEKSMARSDEQLAYYVAQAKEVIDLSVMSQKQIIEELQQAGAKQAPAGTAAP